MLVGREAEMAALRSALDRAAGGEAVAMLVDEARAAGALVLIGHCVDVGEGELPYAPVAAVLRARLCTINPRTTPEDVERTVRRLAELLRPDAAARAPHAAAA